MGFIERLGLVLVTGIPFIVTAILFGSLVNHINFKSLAKLMHKIGGVTPAERIEEELKRKTFHLQAMLIPGYEYTVLKFKICNRRELLMGFGVVIVPLLCMELLRMFNSKFNALVIKFFGPLLRPAEKRTFTGATPLIIAIFTTFLLFPPVVFTIGMAYLCFGDAAAAVIGVSFGKHKILGKKSLEGTLGCACACSIVGCLCLQLLTKTPLMQSIWISLESGLMTALAELISNERMDDNLTIPIVASFSVYMAGVLQGADFVRRDGF